MSDGRMWLFVNTPALCSEPRGFCAVHAWMSVAAKVAHCGSETGSHVSPDNPAATFSRSRRLHKLKERLSERDRKEGEGGNDEGGKRERQLMNEGGERESRRLKKKKKKKGCEAARKGERKEGQPFDMDSVKH